MHRRAANRHHGTFLLSRKVVADREGSSLAAGRPVDDLCISPPKFPPHDVTASRHGMLNTVRGRVAANRPVKLARVNFDVAAPLSHGPFELGL
jgi:hypothetical protein